MAGEAKGCKELFTEVIEAGLCALCGACTGTCPYLVYYKGRIVLLDKCTLSKGQCYEYCPRTYADMDAISKRVFGTPYSGDEIGVTKGVFMARSTDVHIREKAQYGGVVTTLLTLALSEGLIDSAILTKASVDKSPTPFLAQDVEAILQCAGSNYMTCPVVARLNQIPKDDDGKLGIVAMPCQVLAITKMKQVSLENRVDAGNIKLIVGLFCTWALSLDRFYKFLSENLDLSLVKKFDIPPPPANNFDVYTASAKLSFPLEQIRQYAMPTCAYCLDMTSEFADISVGAAEGIEGWNTVITRTDTGAELLKLAEAKREIEIDKLPIENLGHLKEAALLKKKRALNEIIKRTGSRDNLLYVGLSSRVTERLLE
jgi:coenzyme F420 hydrogenase subunit beta